MIITVDEAMQHLYLEPEEKCEQGPIVEAYIKAASAAIRTYLAGGELDEAGNVRDDVKSACKLLVADFYRFRETDKGGQKVDAQHGYGYLPAYVTALLYPYRQPVMA